MPHPSFCEGWDSTSADRLGFFADSVSLLTRCADMYATTLHDFVKALPGELKITAKFPEATVEITQFEDVTKAATGKD